SGERTRRLCSWDDLRVDRSRGCFSAALVAVRIARRGRSDVFYSPRHQTSWICVDPREVLISFFYSLHRSSRFHLGLGSVLLYSAALGSVPGWESFPNISDGKIFVCNTQYF